MPQEDLVVGLLVGSGVRVSEACGLSVAGPDGLPDLMLDSMPRGPVELRVRWDAGAKGKKSRRVPITLKLAAAIKRYEGRHRLGFLRHRTQIQRDGNQLSTAAAFEEIRACNFRHASFQHVQQRALETKRADARAFARACH